ncbi:MAG TPA: metallophosphoesterase [Polyangiales bacterium]
MACADAAVPAGAADPDGMVDADARTDGSFTADADAVVSSSVVVLPDTQFYTCAYPAIFNSQAQWVLDHHESRQIELVLHTGDIVDMGLPSQWQTAAESLHRLDSVVPYLLTTGNHDMAGTRASLFGQYFRVADVATNTWELTSRDPTRVDNSYAVITLNGQRWIFLGLEFSPRDAVVQWASDVLAAHADLPAVLFTHAYLYSDGRRYDRSIQPMQPYHPDLYRYTPDEGMNDGEDLWRKLIEPHENVRLVLSGHVIPDGTAHSTATRKSGSQVHQVLANYQGCDACPCSQAMGGGGYLRVLTFDQTGERIHVSTYSPYLKAALTEAENDFLLPLR